MLRYDIDKFKDAKDSPTKQFSIYDEADAQSLVEILTQELQLDPSGSSPKDPLGHQQYQEPGMAADQQANTEGQQGKLTADVYQHRKRWRPTTLWISTICYCCRFSCSAERAGS